MNLHQLDKKATDDVFRLMGRRVRYQFKDGTNKTCRAIILRGATYDPVNFQSHVLDDEVNIVVRKKDINRPQQEDLIVVGSDTYVVSKIIEDDGVVIKVSVR